MYMVYIYRENYHHLIYNSTKNHELLRSKSNKTSAEFFSK